MLYFAGKWLCLLWFGGDLTQSFVVLSLKSLFEIGHFGGINNENSFKMIRHMYVLGIVIMRFLWFEYWRPLLSLVVVISIPVSGL